MAIVWKYLIAALIVVFSVLFKCSRSFRFYSKLYFYYVVVGLACSVACLPCFLTPMHPENVLYLTVILKRLNWLVGFKAIFVNPESIPKGRRFILVVNHQSSLDVHSLVTNWEAVSPCVPSMKKELLFTGPMGLFAFISGCVFVDRGNSERAREALNRRLEDVRSGKTSILIFAEGTRNEEPKLLPFKKGAFHMAVQCQVPIVPLVISRYSSFFSTKEKKYDAGHVRITALPEVSTEGMGPNDVADLASMVQDIMQTAIDNELAAEERRRFGRSYAAALLAS